VAVDIVDTNNEATANVVIDNKAMFCIAAVFLRSEHFEVIKR